MRNISFSLTTPQFIDGTKDVTRRIGWETAKAGEVLRAVEKGMGLKKGEKVKPLAMIVLADVRVERLDRILSEPSYGRAEVRREGFPDMTPEQFVEFFCRSHSGCFPEREITRLEFKKLPLVHQVFSLHMRGSDGSTMGYNLVNEGGSIIGAKSSWSPGRRARERGQKARTIYTLFPNQEFETAADFLTTYQRQLDGVSR